MSVLLSTAIMCPELPAIDNGMVSWTGLSPGDIATYTCDPGFILVGVSTRNCGSDGTWSGEEPTCERKLLSPLHIYGCTNIRQLYIPRYNVISYINLQFLHQHQH